MKLLSSRHVLGINSRNLDLVRPLNKRRAITFSKNKIRVKSWLRARGIPVPKTLAVIKHTSEISTFNFKSLPDKVVLKPALGAGGDGILLLTRTKKGNFKDPKGKVWMKRDLKQHITDILDGKFTSSRLPDMVLFEQLLTPHPFFTSLAAVGMPDIRVIVFRQVPVMAMVRLPSPSSGGLANLHQGGVMVGIDIPSGEMTHIATNSGWGRHKILTSIPWSGRTVSGLVVPFWQDILILASRIQPLTNLGYLAVDFAIDAKFGPMVLEINARGGLGIQVANRAPLRERLDRVRGLKIPNAEKGVSIARDLFAARKKVRSHIHGDLQGRGVIGTLEIVKIFHADRRRYHQLPAKITPTKQKTILDLELARTLGLADDQDQPGARKKIKIEIEGQRMTLAAVLSDLASKGKEYRFNIGSNDLTDFLIDPTRKNSTATDILEKKKVAESEFQKGVLRLHYRQVDAELASIDNQLKILSYLRPLNLKEERENFFADPTEKYNPQFEYRPPSFKPDRMLKRLDKIETDDTPLGEIFERKRLELISKINLIQSAGKDSIAFTNHSLSLFGSPDPDLISKAKSELAKIPDTLNKRVIKKYSSEEAAAKLSKFLFKNGLPWTVELKEHLITGAAAGKDSKLFIKSGMRFAKPRIDALISHEIETHIFITENAKRQPYQIFQHGTAGYHLAHEGLAAFNQQYRGGDRRKIFFWARNVLAVDFALTHSFSETFHFVRQLGFGKHQSWGITLRLKRGIGDTSEPGAFTKDIIYLKGLYLIENFVLDGGDISQLYLGKIAISDLPALKQVEGLQPPHLIPQPIPDAIMLENAMNTGVAFPDMILEKTGDA